MESVCRLFYEGEKVRWLLCTIYLLICAVQDIRKRAIGVGMSLCAGGAVLFLDAASLVCGRAESLIGAGVLVPESLSCGAALPPESLHWGGVLSPESLNCGAVLLPGIMSFAAALLPGILLLLLAALSGGAAGSGDGICFLVVGALVGTWTTWALMMCALILAGIWGAVLMALRRAGRKTHLPFLAFTAAAWAGILAARISGINW